VHLSQAAVLLLQMTPVGVMHASGKRLYAVLAIAFLVLFWLRFPITVALAIFSLPVMWNLRASSFLLSRQRDDFDLAFANYSARQVASLPDYPDLVLPILHHIALSYSPASEQVDWPTA
jgi:inositol phosphorylceramide mannosyltransferase catalytic subunit